jgi:hypothetical protein
MVRLLLPSLRDPRPMVRCIAGWALTRYSRWLLERARQGQRSELDSVVQVRARRGLELHLRRVQPHASIRCSLRAAESWAAAC